MSAPTSRVSFNRRALLRAGAGMAGILATGRATAFAQAQPKKLVFAHINAIPESAAVAVDWMAKEATAQSKGALDVQFFGKTLIPQELEIMNAVKSGSVAMGSPAGAAATVFPEMGALLVPYLVKDYASAYAMLNGKIGDKISKQIEDNYKLKVMCYFDYGFRHFWTSKKPIVEPKDLRGMKIRVQQAKIFGDTINGLGGSAIPMAYGEVVTAAKEKIREATESVDNFAKAKSELEPLGMTVVEAKVDEFRKVAQQKIWPAYRAQYGALWEEIEGFKV